MKKVFLLEGNWFQRQEVLNKIKEHLDVYTLYSFDENNNYEYLKQVISEISCFEEKKLIIVDAIPKIKAPDKAQRRSKVLNNLKKILPKVPSGNIVVLNNLNISGKSFIDFIKKIGKVYIFEKNIKKYKACDWVVNYFKEKNKIITIDDAFLIANSLGAEAKEVNIDKLYLLVKKVEQYTANKKNIVKNDILLVCSQIKEFVVWNLYNCFDDKDFCNSLKMLKELLTFSKNTEHEIVQLMHQLQWKYNLLLLAKNGVNNKKLKKDVCDEILKLNKLERKGVSKNIIMNLMIKNDEEVPVYSIGMINSIFEERNGRKASLSCYSFNQLLLINCAITKTLTRIRGGCTPNEIFILIEFIFMTICGIVNKESTLNLLENQNLEILKEYNFGKVK